MSRTLSRPPALLLPLLLAAALFPGPCLAAPAAAGIQPDRLTNPLLRYVKFRELRPFSRAIAERIYRAKADGEAETVSVYFRSLAEGMWFGVDESEAFTPASILKIPIMMTYYKLAAKTPSILEKKFKYEVIPIEDSPDLVASPAKSGRTYTVEQLIGLMISYSDNNAAAALFNGLPLQSFADTFEDFGMDVHSQTFLGDFVSLKIAASLLRVLYNSSYLNENMSERALGHLMRSKFKHGIRAGVPPGYPVANKFGSRKAAAGEAKQLHDIAIVYYPGNPYLLAVMTKGKGADFTRLAGVIHDISAIVFREVSAQTSGVSSAPDDVAIE